MTAVKSTLKNTVKAGLVGMLALGASATAFAGGSYDKSALMDWAKEAGQSVDEVMFYPKMTRGTNAQGLAEFRVTVDEDGNILKSEMTDTPSNHFIRRAAKSVVSTVDLPDLPEGYDRLTFSLRLNYAIVDSPLEAQRLKRRTNVTTRQIAGERGPVTAGLKVISVSMDSE